ncbi:MAG: 3-oxoacyl-[acyl-carrier-protein] synthase-3 [Verrucomicrobiales bacterium]|jgi:3-oxoacyl-[acyl-carrier-protein] synthase-3
MSAGSRIIGWGSNLPEKILTNDDLAAGGLDTNDAWIFERTGIKQRHVGGSTGEMSIHAGRQALDRAGVTGADIDLVIVATSTPDQLMPGTSATVHAELGIRGGACDMQAVCSGFTYALMAANGLIGTGLERILVIGADTLSDYVDWEDRGSAILFGDGAGAVVLERHDTPTLLGFDLGADGHHRHIGYTDHNGKITMDGKEVFRTAVRAVTQSAKNAMENAGVTAGEIDWFVPHQANVRIIEAIANRLDIPMEKAIVTIQDTANNSAATIPIALDTAVVDQRIQPGDLLLLGGFGFGMTWASAIMRWEPNV